VAETIAKHLSGRSYIPPRSDQKDAKVWEFQYNHEQKTVTMVVTHVLGHLFELEFVKKTSWDQQNPAELFDARVQKKLRSSDRGPGSTFSRSSFSPESIKRTLEKEARLATHLILWLDCDREGENIAFEVIDICKAANARLKIMRAHFSAMTREHMVRAMSQLKQPKKSEADAVDARQEIDLRLGAAFTRMQTLALRQYSSGAVESGRRTISWGPCQIPTLGFVVDRYRARAQFVPQPFWYLEMYWDGKREASTTGEESKKSNTQSSSHGVTFRWARGRLFDETSVQVLRNAALSANEAVIIKATTAPRTRSRPTPLNTVELQKRAASYFGMSSNACVESANKLYHNGYISYPRTETDEFDRSEDLQKLIRNLTECDTYAQYANRLLNGKFAWPLNGGHNDKAHPPIHPLKPPDSSFTQNEQQVYDLVARHFLACCSQDAKGVQTNVEAMLGEEVFHCSGVAVIESNWYDVYPWEKWSDRTIPSFAPGDKFKPTAVNVVRGETTPPSLMTESELINTMDKSGIGTDATIAKHIQAVKDRGYVIEVNGRGEPLAPEGTSTRIRNSSASSNTGTSSSGVASGRTIYLQPTALGLALIDAYIAMQLQLASPILRALMERGLNDVAKQKQTKESMVLKAINDMRPVFAQFECSLPIFRAIVGHTLMRGDQVLPESSQPLMHPSGPGVTNESSLLVEASDRVVEVVERVSLCGRCGTRGIAVLKLERNAGPNATSRRRRVLQCLTCAQEGMGVSPLPRHEPNVLLARLNSLEALHPFKSAEWSPILPLWSTGALLPRVYDTSYRTMQLGPGDSSPEVPQSVRCPLCQYQVLTIIRPQRNTNGVSFRTYCPYCDQDPIEEFTSSAAERALKRFARSEMSDDGPSSVKKEEPELSSNALSKEKFEESLEALSPENRAALIEQIASGNVVIEQIQDAVAECLSKLGTGTSSTKPRAESIHGPCGTCTLSACPLAIGTPDVAIFPCPSCPTTKPPHLNSTSRIEMENALRGVDSRVVLSARSVLNFPRSQDAALELANALRSAGFDLQSDIVVINENVPLAVRTAIQRSLVPIPPIPAEISTLAEQLARARFSPGEEVDMNDGVGEGTGDIVTQTAAGYVEDVMQTVVVREPVQHLKLLLRRVNPAPMNMKTFELCCRTCAKRVRLGAISAVPTADFCEKCAAQGIPSRKLRLCFAQDAATALGMVDPYLITCVRPQCASFLVRDRLLTPWPAIVSSASGVSSTPLSTRTGVTFNAVTDAQRSIASVSGQQQQQQQQQQQSNMRAQPVPTAQPLHQTQASKPRPGLQTTSAPPTTRNTSEDIRLGTVRSRPYQEDKGIYARIRRSE